MVEPIYFNGVSTLSFKQLDELNAQYKGSSFRAFKRVRDGLAEGSDYFYLPAAEHASFIDELRRRGVIYASTENLVLITEAGYARMRAAPSD